MKVNFVGKCIEVSNAEMKRAQNYGSYEYEMMMRVTKELPEFRIVVQQPTRKAFNPHAGYSRDADGKWIWRYNKNDGHGGHGPEHRREME